MDRRTFGKTAVAGALTASHALAASQAIADEPDAKTHVVTLSFDDGFKKSCYKIADVYEEFGLHACFNVIASGHLPSFEQVGDWILPELLGNFNDWNALKACGHEIMPHGWKHMRLTEMPLDEAKVLIVKCLDYFEEHLDGFEASEAVFNYPYLSSNEALDKFVLSKVRALRTWGKSVVNPLPTELKKIRIASDAKGPEDCSDWVEEHVDTFLEGEGGWLLVCLHGLTCDGWSEGWGPIPEDYLRKLLSRLQPMPHVAVLPAGVVIETFAT